MNDLQARLDDLTRQATGGAEPPDPAAIARRGRARRRRQRAVGAALAALALALVVSVARGGLLPAPGPVAPAAGGNDAPAVRSLGPWAGRADATVLLAPDVSPARRAAIRARLEALPMVDTVWYESRDEALAAFRAQFRDAPDIVQGVTASAMADSFRVRLTGPGTLAELREALCGGRAIGCGDDAIDQVADVLQFTREPLIGPGWAGRADVTIVLRDDVTPAGLSALRERAAGVEGVTSVTYVPATPGRPGPPRASIPGSPYPDLGTPASLKVAIAETADAARFLPALCRTELTGDCADGVAMVIEHPRVVDTATPGP